MLICFIVGFLAVLGWAAHWNDRRRHIVFPAIGAIGRLFLQVVERAAAWLAHTKSFSSALGGHRRCHGVGDPYVCCALTSLSPVRRSPHHFVECYSALRVRKNSGISGLTGLSGGRSAAHPNQRCLAPRSFTQANRLYYDTLYPPRTHEDNSVNRP